MVNDSLLVQGKGLPRSEREREAKNGCVGRGRGGGYVMDGWMDRWMDDEQEHDGSNEKDTPRECTSNGLDRNGASVAALRRRKKKRKRTRPLE